MYIIIGKNSFTNTYIEYGEYEKFKDANNHIESMTAALMKGEIWHEDNMILSLEIVKREQEDEFVLGFYK